MRKPASFIIAGLVAMSLALSACSSDTTAGGDKTGVSGTQRQVAVAQITDDVILPGLAESNTTAAVLEKSIGGLCAAPDAASLESAREAWREARLAWMATSAYRVGPISELRSRAKIAYPVNSEKLEALLASGTVDLGKIDELGADLRGLGGVEYALFTPADVSALAPARCSYAQAAAKSVAAGTAELSDAWTKGYAKEFKASGQDAIDQLVNAALGSLAMVDDATLGESLVGVEGAAKNGLADGSAELGSVEAVWGKAPDGLAGLVASKSESAAQNFGGSLRSAVTALGKLTSLDDSPAKTAAAKHVEKARVELRTEVSSQLGVTVTFTDSDGDG